MTKLKPYQRNNDARAQAGRIIELYRGGHGHKTIAKAMGLSARIVRVVLIEQGEWRPGTLFNNANKRESMSRTIQASLKARTRRTMFKRALERNARSFTATLKKWQRHERKVRTKARNRLWAQAEKAKYHGSIQHRLRCVLRRRIRKVIEKGVRAGTSLELLGCTTVEFKTHLENHFELGMSWENYGLWHLDHRRPCASFDLTKPEQQRACFHYTNYRPMWGTDNLAKSSMWRGKRHVRKRVILPMQ